MRRLWALAVVALLAASCGGDDASAPESVTVPPAATGSTVTSPVTTTSAATTTTTTTTGSATTSTQAPVAGPLWSVARYGRAPIEAIGGRALGSGCTPGTDDLPDGIWFGWIESSGPNDIEFDLACLWPGRMVAVSNDATRVRVVAASPDTLVYGRDGGAVPFGDWTGEANVAQNAPGLPQFRPHWVFVNQGVATEIAEYPEPIAWAIRPSAWPSIAPGCCEGGTVAPPSPTGPWPESGWPSDGFYQTSVTVSDTSLDVTLRKWLRCTDYPETCAPHWTGDEVTTDPDAPTLERSIPFDRDLTVVIKPILSDAAIVGDGQAFRDLLDDVHTSVEAWIGDVETPVSGEELLELADDPAFPFGIPESPHADAGWPIGYRGPGGAHLTYDTPVLGWTALEIGDDSPILYVHAGIVAG